MSEALKRRVVWLAKQQMDHYLNTQWLMHPGFPEWYETKRKTTHVIFWQ